jgi:lysophospholipase L1-like esterase
MLNLILFFIAVGLLLIALIAYKRTRAVGGGLMISYITILLILGGSELYMRCCYVESDNLPTLAQQNWLAKYAQPNSLGFRDREWTLADWEGKTTVVVLGDSFTAGNGIANPEDRYSSVLARHLGDDYAVINLGVSGTSTYEQLQILKDFPLKNPDVVIWQYFLNDINYTGLKLNVMPIPPELPPLARESHLANYLYWRFSPPSQVITADGQVYPSWFAWTYAAYDNAGIWDVHRQEIEEAVDYVDSIGAELTVIIYPELTDIVGTIPYVDRVAQVFEAKDVTNILKLFDAAAAWNPDDLTVSRRDTHASVSFNHYVGDTLYELYFQGR